MSPDIIRLEDLTRSYGPRRGVERVSLTVPAGARFGFLGPNGAGKTTTIRVLLGFLRPTSGAARIFGRDCWCETQRIKRDVGYLPGDLRLYPGFSGGTIMEIIGSIRGMDLVAPSQRLALRFALDMGVVVRRMSRGMRQKLGLIIALAHDPSLLILDEPTASLDPIVQETLLALLRERSNAGRTVFFSSHSLGEVEQLCDHVAIVREGRLVTCRTLQALREEASRHVMIRFRTLPAEDLEPPVGLTLEQRKGTHWEGELNGSVKTLLDWLQGRGIEDLEIGPPGLETLFRVLYQQGAAS